MSDAPSPLAQLEAEFNSGASYKDIARAITVACENGVIAPHMQFALIQALRDNLFVGRPLDIEYSLEGFDDLPILLTKKLRSPPGYDGLARIAHKEPDVVVRHDERIARLDGEPAPDFFDSIAIGRPRLRIASLRGATVVNSSIVLSHRRTILRETIDFDSPDKVRRYLPSRRSKVKTTARKLYYNIDARPTRVRLVPGAAVLLSSERKFFATWMIHLFTRLYALDYLQREDLSFIVPTGLWANCIDMVEALGFPRDRVIAAEPDELLICDTLFIPNSPAFEWDYARAEALRPYQELRERLLGPDDGAPPTEHVYISRADGRGKMPINETAIAELMVSKGFKVLQLSQMSIAEKLAALGAARLVVCPLGSGAFNALLCRPGQVGLVFIGGHYQGNTPIASLPALLDAPVSHVIGAVDVEAALAANDGVRSALGMGDFDIDLEALSRVLDEAIAAQDARDRERRG